MQEILKALAHPIRREILAMLRVAPHNAGEIFEEFDVSKPTITGHLNILKDAELISPIKNGTSITYHIRLSVLEEALGALMGKFNIVDKQKNTEEK